MCIGEHFYATSTMQQTLAGSMHAFVAHYAITNTNHIPLSLVLRRMSYFYYLGLVLDDIPGTSFSNHSVTPCHVNMLLQRLTAIISRI
jgi:hypothetical protein